MPEISGYIFAVCVCCIKIPSNFFYFFNFLPFCTKEVTLSQSLPTMLSMEWPGGFTISWLVQFMGNKFVIYLRIGPLVILQTVVVYIMYQEPTKCTSFHWCIFIAIFSPTCFSW